MTYIEERLAKLEEEVRQLRRRLDLLEDQQPDVLSTSETAELLGLHRNTIMGWIRDGKLPAEKVGRNWRVNRSDVLKLLDADDLDD